jgi:hypothetical protein
MVLVTCSLCGATIHNVSDKLETHTEFHRGHVPVQEVHAVSMVKWCDVGDHPFKAGIAGSGSFTGQEYDENGVAVMAQMDYCPDDSPQKQVRHQRALARYAKTGTPEDLQAVTDTVE